MHVGHGKTMQARTRRHMMWSLIGIFTVNSQPLCKNTINMDRKVHLIRVGKCIHAASYVNKGGIDTMNEK